MAAVLPAINPAGSKLTHGQGKITRNVGSVSVKENGANVQIKKLRNKDQAEEKIKSLRSQNPFLTKKDTIQYRNSFKQNLCLEMLQNGFHKSFAEVYALIKQQNEARLKAGPESLMWNQLMLENEPEKLNMLSRYLCQAEAAERADDYSQVYSSYYALARYFTETNDKWLVDHFFDKCLNASSNVTGDEGIRLAEAYYNMGRALEAAGDTAESLRHFQLFHGLCSSKPEWELESGQNMVQEACRSLNRVYLKQAEEYSNSDNIEDCLGCLQQALNIASDGQDNKQLAETCFRLGEAYAKAEDYDTALVHLQNYLEICQMLLDAIGIGKACEAIARCYERQDRVEESVRYLQMYLGVAEQCKDDPAISSASTALGATFNLLGRYEQAVECFNKAYNIARATALPEGVNLSRAMYGIAAGHKMLVGYSRHIENGRGKVPLKRLLEWKDSRTDEFEKEIPKEEKKVEKAEDNKSSTKQENEEPSAAAADDVDEKEDES